MTRACLLLAIDRTAEWWLCPSELTPRLSALFDSRGISITEAAQRQLHRPPQPWLALGADFEQACGRPPHNAQELVQFGKTLVDTTGRMNARLMSAKNMLDKHLRTEFAEVHGLDCTDSDMLGLVQGILDQVENAGIGLSEAASSEMLTTLDEQFQNIYGRAPRGDDERLALLKRLADGLEGKGSWKEPLPSNLQEALYFQIEAAKHVDSSDEEKEELALLRALIARPDGAAAAVVVLQDRAAQQHEPHLPGRVLSAVEDFAKSEGLECKSEADAVSFMKQMLMAGAGAARAFQGGSAAPFGGATPFSALVTQARMQESLNTALATQFESVTGRPPADPAELVRFAKDVASSAHGDGISSLDQSMQLALATAGTSEGQQLNFLDQMVQDLETSDNPAFTKEFQMVNGRPPADTAELVGFAKQLASSAHDFGGKSLDQSMQVAIAEGQQLQFLDQMVKDLENSDNSLAILATQFQAVNGRTLKDFSELLEFGSAAAADSSKAMDQSMQQAIENAATFTAQFETANGKPPADAAELVSFAKQLASSAHDSGGKSLDPSMQVAIAEGQQLKFLDQMVKDLERSEDVSTAFTAQFEVANGKPPADTAELVGFAKQMASSAHEAGGVKALDQSMQLAIANGAATKGNQVQFLDQTIAVLETHAHQQEALNDVSTTFAAQFELANGKAPADPAELLAFAKDMASSAHEDGGIKSLDQSMQLALATAGASEGQQLRFLDQMVAGLDTRTNVSNSIDHFETAVAKQFEISNGRAPANNSEVVSFAKELASAAHEDGGIKRLGTLIKIAVTKGYQNVFDAPATTDAQELQFLDRMVAGLEKRENVNGSLENVSKAFYAQFEAAEGRPPTGTAELVQFAKEQVGSAQDSGGVKQMDSSITRALANEHQNVYGKAAATEEQQLQFLNKMVAGLENPKELEMAMTFSALKGDYTFSASLKFTGEMKNYDNADFRKAQVDKFDQLLGVKGGSVTLQAGSVIVNYSISGLSDEQQNKAAAAAEKTLSDPAPAGRYFDLPVESVSYKVTTTNLLPSSEGEVLSVGKRLQQQSEFGSPTSGLAMAEGIGALGPSGFAAFGSQGTLSAGLGEGLFSRSAAGLFGPEGESVTVVKHSGVGDDGVTRSSASMAEGESGMPHGGMLNDAFGSQQMLQLPPQLMAAMEEEYKRRYGAAPADGAVVLTRFFASLTGEYAEDARKAEAAHNFSKAMRRRSLSGAAPTSRQDAGAIFKKTAKKASMATARVKLPTGLEMAGAFQMAQDSHAGHVATMEAHTIVKDARKAHLRPTTADRQSRRSILHEHPSEHRHAKQRASVFQANLFTSFGLKKLDDWTFEVGVRVVHPKHGAGVVAELMADGRTRVAFDNGEEHRYKPSSMHKLHAASEADAAAAAVAAAAGAAKGGAGGAGADPLTKSIASLKRASTQKLQVAQRGVDRMEGSAKKLMGLAEEEEDKREVESSAVQFKATFEGTVDQFDEWEAKERIAAQMGGAAAGVTAQDIDFSVKSGSVIVSATIKVRTPDNVPRASSRAIQRWQRYARAAMALKRLLSDKETAESTFGLELRQVDEAPKVTKLKQLVKKDLNLRKLSIVGRLEGDALERAVDAALGVRDMEGKAVRTEDEEAVQAQAKERPLLFLCCLPVLLLAGVAAAAVFGSEAGASAPDASIAVPLSLAGAGSVGLLAACYWLASRARRRRSKKVAQRADLKRKGTLSDRLARGESGTIVPTAAPATDAKKVGKRPAIDVAVPSPGSPARRQGRSMGADDRVAPRSSHPDAGAPSVSSQVRPLRGKTLLQARMERAAESGPPAPAGAEGGGRAPSCSSLAPLREAPSMPLLEATPVFETRVQTLKRAAGKAAAIRKMDSFASVAIAAKAAADGADVPLWRAPPSASEGAPGTSGAKDENGRAKSLDAQLAERYEL